MTTETMIVDPPSEFEIDELHWELELLDTGWVDAEFAAIMIASGFGDRIISAAEPHHVGGAITTVSSGWRPRLEWDRRSPSSRVRSPPARQ